MCLELQIMVYTRVIFMIINDTEKEHKSMSKCLKIKFAYA